MDGKPSKDIISNLPTNAQKRFVELYDLIQQTAKSVPQISQLEESIKWGQLSLSAKPKGLGSSIRLDKQGDGISLYFICHTGLVGDFKEIYPNQFNYIGNREIHFALDDEIDEEALSHCVSMALLYHHRKKCA